MKPFLSKRLCSFTYLNITQFLGALNDNVFKLLLVFFLIDLQGEEKSSTILAKAGAVFVIPFLLFSTPSGKLADRFSKRNIIIFSKGLEVVVMFLGILSFLLKTPTGAYTTLFLMATQSSIFSPSKYGIIPELVKPENISKANGLLTSFTFLAIIIGTFLASFITDISNRNFLFATSSCLLIAIVGLATSLHIQYTPPVGCKKKFSPFFFYEVYKTIRLAKQHNRLFCAIMGSAFFLFIGAYLQLNIIPFTIQSLKKTDVQGGYLFLITALGIGTGSFIAGKISGKHIELGLTPIAGYGMALSCFFLYLLEPLLYTVIPLIISVGLFGGIWIVPFDSFIQTASPAKVRGQMVATTNFLSFVGVLLASGVLYFLSEILHLKASQGFLFIALFSFLITLGINIVIMDYFLRFIASIISRLFFRLSIFGESDTPSSPCLILCNKSSLFLEILVLTSIHPPPFRFLIESKQHKKSWAKTLCSILRVSLVPPQYTLEQKETLYNTVKSHLKKGCTICLFAKNAKKNIDVISKYQEDFQSLLKNTPFSIRPVKIQAPFFSPSSTPLFSLLKNFPWDVHISFAAVKHIEKNKKV